MFGRRYIEINCAANYGRRVYILLPGRHPGSSE